MNRTYQAFENIRYTESELKKRGYKPIYILDYMVVIIMA